MNNIKVRLFFRLGFILLSFLLTLHYGFSRIEKDSTVNAPVILSMEELGYEQSNPYGSYLEKSMVADTEVMTYYLYVHNEYNDFLKFYVFDCENHENARELLESIIIVKKETEFKNKCTGDCYFGDISFESASNGWMILDDWNVDVGYSSFDYHNEPSEGMGWYDVVLVKDQYAMEVNVDKDIEMTDDTIAVLVSMFDRVDTLFE